MRYFVSFLLLVGLLGCKEGVEHKTDAKDNINISDCFPYQDVDSIAIYYIKDKRKCDYCISYNDFIINGKKHHNQIVEKELDMSDVNLFNKLYDSHIILSDTESINQLKSIFISVSCPSPSDQYETTCDPIFRDVILFYKNDSIFSGIKICFDCEEIVFSKTVERNRCFKYSNQFKILKDYFNKNIHPITN